MGEKEDNKALVKQIRDSEHRAHKRKKQILLFKKVSIVGALGISFVLWVVGNSIYKDTGHWIVTENNIHWHAHLSIKIRGVEKVVTPNIGLDGSLEHPSTLHTHETDGVIHMEMDGPVEARQLMFKRFMEVWEDKPDLSGAVIMVNGRMEPNIERYVMRDGDEIEINL